MRKLTTSVAAVAGLVIATVTLRKFRSRGATVNDADEAVVEPVHEEAVTAGEHAVAAAEHARLAAEQVVESRRD